MSLGDTAPFVLWFLGVMKVAIRWEDDDDPNFSCKIDGAAYNRPQLEDVSSQFDGHSSTSRPRCKKIKFKGSRMRMQKIASSDSTHEDMVELQDTSRYMCSRPRSQAAT